MIRLECAQGSPEWHAARLGIPTASNFGRIVTPGGKLSASADGYMHELIAERMLGMPLNTESIDFMERGKALETHAADYYELQRGVDTEAVGFALTDDRRAGCSPDRFVGLDGGLEIKCPSPAVHVGYLIDGSISDKYRPQVQGSLWITGRWWWDTLSYHPDLPIAMVRVERDEEFIAALAVAVAAFCDRLDAACERLGVDVARAAKAGVSIAADGSLPTEKPPAPSPSQAQSRKRAFALMEKYGIQNDDAHRPDRLALYGKALGLGRLASDDEAKAFSAAQWDQVCAWLTATNEPPLDQAPPWMT